MAAITSKLSEQDVFRRMILSSCCQLMVHSFMHTRHRAVGFASGSYSSTPPMHVTRRHRCFLGLSSLDPTIPRTWTLSSSLVSIILLPYNVKASQYGTHGETSYLFQGLFLHLLLWMVQVWHISMDWLVTLENLDVVFIVLSLVGIGRPSLLSCSPETPQLQCQRM